MASVRFRAIWLIHRSVGLGAIPAISTLRVDNSMKKSTRNRCSPRRVHTSTVKKSAATISSQCRVKKLLPSRLPAPLRCRFDPVPLQNVGNRAAGQVVSSWTARPDPTIAPVTVLLAMRTTSFSISLAVRGRPGPRLALPSYFSAISLRCQASNVSGVTMSAMSFSNRRPTSLAFAARRRR